MERLDINSASLTYRHVLEMAGARCELKTNSSALEATLGRWLADDADTGSPALSMEVFVAGDKTGLARHGHFRGLNHVVVASFGRDNLFVFDILRRTVAAKVTDSVARDQAFWNEVLLPIAVGVLGAAIGTLPMHCACLSSEGQGLIVTGASGAGKSTLAAALAQSGFDYISDDWTYIRRQPEGLVAHGMAARLKLLPDSIAHFPQLSEHAVSRSLNGELAFEVTADVFGSRLQRCCEPRWGIFLERAAEPGSQLTPIAAGEARIYLESSVEELPPQLAEVASARARIIGRIAALPWWKFRYGGSPHFAARELRSFVLQQQMAAV